MTHNQSIFKLLQSLRLLIRKSLDPLGCAELGKKILKNIRSCCVLLKLFTTKLLHCQQVTTGHLAVSYARQLFADRVMLFSI